MKHPPRQGDLPVAELVKNAETIVRESRVPVDVLFKFTCEHCGERCTFQEPNKLYEKGECAACGKETVVTVAGYSLLFHYHKIQEQKDN